MDRVIDLTNLLRDEIYNYAEAEAWRGRLMAFQNVQAYTYGTVFLPDPDHPTNPSFIVMAEVVDDKIVILFDKTDHTLLEALLEAGIPRDQIVTTYH
jgi:hypothetical protein